MSHPFYLTESGLEFIGPAPSFRPDMAMVERVRQPASNQEVLASFQDIRNLTEFDDDEAVSATLGSAWSKALNKVGSLLSVALFGGPGEITTMRDAVAWLVANRFPVLSYEHLRTLCLSPVLAGRRRALNLLGAYDAFVSDSGERPQSERSRPQDDDEPFSRRVLPRRSTSSSGSSVDSSVTMNSLAASMRSLQETMAGFARSRALENRSPAQPAPPAQPSSPALTVDDIARALGNRLLPAQPALPAQVSPALPVAGVAVIEGPSSPYSRLIAKLHKSLETSSFVKVFHYSAAHREAVSQMNTKTSLASRLTFADGAIRAVDDDGEDIAVTETWKTFASGYRYMLRIMCGIPNCKDQVLDRLEFLDFLEDQCSHMGLNRTKYAEEFMFKHAKAKDWADKAFLDTGLIFKFTESTMSSRPLVAPPPRARPPSVVKNASGSPRVPGQVPTQLQPGDHCRSRISKSFNGSATKCQRQKCKFLHTCPYCFGAPDHPASGCPLAPP
jgi:hypothetical protein